MSFRQGQLSAAKRLASVLLALFGACLNLAGARELALLVPSDEDEATSEFVSALNSAPQIKEAGLTFRPVLIDAVGPQSQASTNLLDGKVPLALIRATQLPGFDAKEYKFTSLLSQPLMLRDSKQQFYVEDSVVGDAVLQELGRKGFVVLGFWNAPGSSLVFKGSVKTYAELKGRKVRAGPESQSSDVLQALGAIPTPMAAADVVNALRQGAIDGSVTRVDQKSPYLTEIKGGSLFASFQHGPGFFVANEASWLELKERERAAIQAAAVDARIRARQAVLRAEDSLPELARASGFNYTSFVNMGDGQQAARATWLRRAGENGNTALGVFDQVVRRQPPAPAPRGTPQSQTRTRIFFATNRSDEGDPNLSYRFGPKRVSKQLVCGEVSYTPDVGRRFGIAHRGAIGITAGTSRGATPCAQMVSAAVGNNRALIIFIHGFKNTFDFAVRRAIAFSEDFGLEAPVLVYSWPSRGDLSGYNYDRASVDFTRPFTKELVEALSQRDELKSISVLAHSMGSQVAFQALEYLTASGKSIQGMAFVAPDVPRTVFVQGIQRYGSSTKLVTMYANEHDRALFSSSQWNGEAPAGLGGSSRLTTSGVETVDVSEVDAQLIEINHSHGFDVPEVAKDVSVVVRQNLRASLRNLPSSKQNGMTYWMIQP